MSVVLKERPAEGVLVIRINRPEHFNAVTLEARQLIVAALEDAALDDAIKVAILTGSDKAFVAGGDLNEMKDTGPIEQRARGIHLLWDRIAAFPKPLIAAVNGYAIGAGCELALHADIVVAGEGARFSLPEVRNGITPGGSGTQRLVRAVGKHRAMWMVLTGSPMSGRDAEIMGLASICVPDDQVMPTALDAAKRIAGMAPLAIAFAKEAIVQGADASLSSALSLERKMMWMLMGTEDKREGMNAFLEKRKPHFKGK